MPSMAATPNIRVFTTGFLHTLVSPGRRTFSIELSDRPGFGVQFFLLLCTTRSVAFIAASPETDDEFQHASRSAIDLGAGPGSLRVRRCASFSRSVDARWVNVASGSRKGLNDERYCHGSGRGAGVALRRHVGRGGCVFRLSDVVCVCIEKGWQTDWSASPFVSSDQSNSTAHRCDACCYTRGIGISVVASEVDQARRRRRPATAARPRRATAPGAGIGL